MSGEDFGFEWVLGDDLRPGMLVLDIRGNARDGSVPEGEGVVEEITDVTRASPSHGREFVKLHIRHVETGAERTRFAAKAKPFRAKMVGPSDHSPERGHEPPRGEAYRTTPKGVDLAEPEAGDEPPRRRLAETYRVLRDTSLARAIKRLHGDRCQVCGEALVLGNGTTYSEAHHIRPLGRPHDGPDEAGNILVLCPNHHALCDLRAMELDLNSLRLHPDHSVDERFVDYHNGLLH